MKGPISLHITKLRQFKCEILTLPAELYGNLALFLSEFYLSAHCRKFSWLGCSSGSVLSQTTDLHVCNVQYQAGNAEGDHSTCLMCCSCSYDSNRVLLQRLAEGRTSVFVAHRLSTISKCDKVQEIASLRQNFTACVKLLGKYRLYCNLHQESYRHYIKRELMCNMRLFWRSQFMKMPSILMKNICVMHRKETWPKAYYQTNNKFWV